MIEWIERLTGQPVAFEEAKRKLPSEHPFRSGGIGYSQFNELLLTLGYDRVTDGFFRYVFGNERSINNFRNFRSGIETFRKKAILEYGNFKYAFKTLSGCTFDEICKVFADLEPIPADSFEKRHSPLLDIKKIARTETPYLGYLIQNQIKDDRTNASSQSEKDRLEKKIRQMRRTIQKGRNNHEVYLSYDHLDVYIATSMRQQFEFWNVSRFIDSLFQTELLRDLNLRWFDPTQAYCDDRIDKGLVEGLMLKRAKCTIYLAQESDTLGKDSELATTLAQGKPVIAFVPKLRNFDSFREFTGDILNELYPGEDKKKIAMSFLQLFDPEGAWTNKKIRSWLNAPKSAKFEDILHAIYQSANRMYDKRADALKKFHPLGVQVNLETGVANGVIVVRSVGGCAKILRSILLRDLDFDIEENRSATILRERLTTSAYRVVTKDKHLTNSFWNFYMQGDE
ncbi:MAG: hypothetical protein IIA68_04640 [Proteobacteria bacterium]|nr:hypothetical protein [Pseudomonadota bacterium]